MAHLMGCSAAVAAAVLQLLHVAVHLLWLLVLAKPQGEDT